MEIVHAFLKAKLVPKEALEKTVFSRDGA